MKALGKNLIVTVNTFSEAMTPGGLHLPETAREGVLEHTVVSVGNAVRLDVKAGNVIVVAKYGGSTFEYEGKKYRAVHEQDVLAVYTN
jgi:chaperonin GroES